jgi:hypothetical protein
VVWSDGAAVSLGLEHHSLGLAQSGRSLGLAHRRPCPHKPRVILAGRMSA